MLSQVVELIENKQHFGITTHIKPDGDGVGSSLGLCWLLKSLGKSAEVVVHGEIPLAYRSLPGADEIRNVERLDRSYDAVFVIECSDLERPGIEGLEDEITVNIDHHATSAHFGTINWIDSTASAVGEMIYNLAKAIGARIEFGIAELFVLEHQRNRIRGRGHLGLEQFRQCGLGDGTGRVVPFLQNAAPLVG